MTQKPLSKKNNLALQGSILIIASVIVRLIGFFYRIPLVNLIGDEGMGYYGKAFDIYKFGLIISSYGLPSAVSKLISARTTKKKYKEAHKIFKTALLLSVFIGLLSAGILYFGAYGLAAISADPSAVYAIRALAPGMLVFAVMAVFRGYFQGMNTMMPTAVSQVFEQVFNAVFSIVMAHILLSNGTAFGAAGGTLGTSIGTFAGLITLIIIYVMANRSIKKRIHRDTHTHRLPSYMGVSKLLFYTSMPILIGSVTFHLTNFVDMIMFNNAMLFHGYAEKIVTTSYGIYTGKYSLVITLPVSIAAALGTATIPSITASLVKKNFTELKAKTDLAYRFIMVLAIPSCVGIFIFAKPILLMFFGTDNIGIASMLLKIGALSIICFGISTISIALLQGINQLKRPVYNAMKSLIIKILFNIIFLFVFNTNLYGAVITNVIFAFSSAYFNMKDVNRTIQFKVNIKRTFIIPTIAALIMGAASFGLYIVFFYITYSNVFSLILAIGMAIFIYMAILMLFKGLSVSELRSLPKGKTLVRILKKVGILDGE